MLNDVTEKLDFLCIDTKEVKQPMGVKNAYVL